MQAPPRSTSCAVPACNLRDTSTVGRTGLQHTPSAFASRALGTALASAQAPISSPSSASVSAQACRLSQHPQLSLRHHSRLTHSGRLTEACRWLRKAAEGYGSLTAHSDFPYKYMIAIRAK